MQEVRTIAEEREKHHKDDETKLWLDHLKVSFSCQSE